MFHAAPPPPPRGTTMAGWPGVKPRHLVALLALHQDGSFRAAATRLGLAQSVVSQRIAQLEQLVGLALVERSRGRSGAILTEAGARVAEHARDILAALDAALTDTCSVASGAGSTLTVGASEGTARTLAAPAIGWLTEHAPDVRIRVHEGGGWQRFFPLVSSGAIDAAFAYLPLKPGPFSFRELTVDQCVLVVRADSPLARRREPPTLAELASLPLIASSWPMLGLIGEHLRATGVEPRFVFRSEFDSAVQALVGQGAGAALMPRSAVIDADPVIAVIPLGDVLPSPRVVLYWHRDRGEIQAITRFLAALDAALAASHTSVPTLPASA